METLSRRLREVEIRKKEYKKVHTIEEPSSKDQQKSQAKKNFMKSNSLPLVPVVMFKEYLQKGIIKHDPKQ